MAGLLGLNTDAAGLPSSKGSQGVINAENASDADSMPSPENNATGTPTTVPATAAGPGAVRSLAVTFGASTADSSCGQGTPVIEKLLEANEEKDEEQLTFSAGGSPAATPILGMFAGLQELALTPLLPRAPAPSAAATALVAMEHRALPAYSQATLLDVACKLLVRGCLAYSFINTCVSWDGTRD